MKFCWCTLQVKNLDASLAFYENIVGLKLNKRFSLSEGTEIAFLGEENTQIELFCNSQKAYQPTCEGISLGFETPSLNDTISLLHAKRISITAGPFQPNPNMRFIHIKDPDGHTVQFVENL